LENYIKLDNIILRWTVMTRCLSRTCSFLSLFS